MPMPTLYQRLWVISATIAVLVFSAGAIAEPPSRVARLSDIGGSVSFSPAGQSEWTQAMLNRPFTTGDRLWSDAKSRAEVQLGGAAIRLGAATSVTVLNLDDRIAQLQLSQGTLLVRVRRLRANQVFEIDTPNLALTLHHPGDYRVSVDLNDDATAVLVRSGDAEVSGQGASYSVTADQGYRFYGTALSDYDLLTVRRDDDLDRWARERDRRSDNSASARFVSPDVVGYEDLDEHGNWRADPDYGNVWIPTHVDAGWTPYHDGHWAWVEPWGWTWVDDAPWGYAVSHYGRWANIRGAWGWVPGPPREQAVYAPALVAFVGGRNAQLSLSIGSSAAAIVGWFPLAPREVYQPSYPVSRGYFEHINRSNAVIAPAVISTVYNTTNVTRNNTTVVNNTNINVTKVVYANQRVSGAVVAVPAQAFVQSQAVAKTAVPVSKEVVASAAVANVAAVPPAPHGAHESAPGAKPPAGEHAVVVRSAPPPAAKPGLTIDAEPRQPPKPAAPPSPAAAVLPSAPAPSAVPPAVPPAPPAGKSPDRRQPEAARPDSPASGVARRGPVPIETAKPDAARIGTPRGDAVRPAAVNADAARAEVAAPPVARPPDARRVDAGGPDSTRSDAVRAAGKAAAPPPAPPVARLPDARRSDAVRPDSLKSDGAGPEAPRIETAKPGPVRVEAPRHEAPRAEAPRPEAPRPEAARPEAARAAPAKVEAARPAPAQAEAARPAPGKAAGPRDGAARSDEEKKKAEEEARKH